MIRRFLSPRWILGHVLVVFAVAVMVNLGLWQLRRLDEKRDFNATVAQRSALAPVAARDALAGGAEPSELDWRPVTVTGTYDASEAVVVVNRSSGGIAGVDSLVPLRAADGSVWLVNRGFVPLALGVPAPPSGTVRVAAYLRLTQTRGTLGAVDSDALDTTEFQRFDVERIARQVDGDVAPMFLQVIDETPDPGGRWPAAVGLPELNEGPHLSYAGQWFLFSAVAVVGWAVVIRRAAREGNAPRASASA